MTLGNEWQTVQAALSGLERIFQVLALPSETFPSATQRRSRRNGNSAIEMRDVSFGYLPGLPVVHRVTLEVQPGEHVALVGRTGAGKSSILHLLGGLYTPWSGAVRRYVRAAQSMPRLFVIPIPRAALRLDNVIYLNEERV